MKRNTVRPQVEKRVEERVYSITDICDMIRIAGVIGGPGYKTMKQYVEEKVLGISPTDLGIECQSSMAKAYYVRSSNLPKIIDGLHLPVTKEQLEAAAPRW